MRFADFNGGELRDRRWVKVAAVGHRDGPGDLRLWAALLWSGNLVDHLRTDALARGLRRFPAWSADPTLIVGIDILAAFTAKLLIFFFFCHGRFLSLNR